MNIRDAAVEAQKIGRGIARKSSGSRPTIFICTNLSDGIFVLPKDDHKLAYAGWMPSLKDLIADDWYAVGKLTNE